MKEIWMGENIVGCLQSEDKSVQNKPDSEDCTIVGVNKIDDDSGRDVCNELLLKVLFIR